MEIQRNQEKGNTKERLAMPLNCEIIFSFSSILVEGNAVACFLSPEGLSMCVCVLNTVQGTDTVNTQT